MPRASARPLASAQWSEQRTLRVAATDALGGVVRVALFPSGALASLLKAPPPRGAGAGASALARQPASAAAAAPLYGGAASSPTGGRAWDQSLRLQHLAALADVRRPSALEASVAAVEEALAVADAQAAAQAAAAAAAEARAPPSLSPLPPGAAGAGAMRGLSPAQAGRLFHDAFRMLDADGDGLLRPGDATDRCMELRLPFALEASFLDAHAGAADAGLDFIAFVRLARRDAGGRLPVMAVWLSQHGQRAIAEARHLLQQQLAQPLHLRPRRVLAGDGGDERQQLQQQLQQQQQGLQRNLAGVLFRAAAPAQLQQQQAAAPPPMSPLSAAVYAATSRGSGAYSDFGLEEASSPPGSRMLSAASVGSFASPGAGTGASVGDYGPAPPRSGPAVGKGFSTDNFGGVSSGGLRGPGAVAGAGANSRLLVLPPALRALQAQLPTAQAQERVRQRMPLQTPDEPRFSELLQHKGGIGGGFDGDGHGGEEGGGSYGAFSAEQFSPRGGLRADSQDRLASAASSIDARSGDYDFGEEPDVERGVENGRGRSDRGHGGSREPSRERDGASNNAPPIGSTLTSAGVLDSSQSRLPLVSPLASRGHTPRAAAGASAELGGGLPSPALWRLGGRAGAPPPPLRWPSDLSLELRASSALGGIGGIGGLIDSSGGGVNSEARPTSMPSPVGQDVAFSARALSHPLSHMAHTLAFGLRPGGSGGGAGGMSRSGGLRAPGTPTPRLGTRQGGLRAPGTPRASLSRGLRVGFVLDKDGEGGDSVTRSELTAAEALEEASASAEDAAAAAGEAAAVAAEETMATAAAENAAAAEAMAAARKADAAFDAVGARIDASAVAGAGAEANDDAFPPSLPAALAPPIAMEVVWRRYEGVKRLLRTLRRAVRRRSRPAFRAWVLFTIASMRRNYAAAATRIQALARGRLARRVTVPRRRAAARRAARVAADVACEAAALAARDQLRATDEALAAAREGAALVARQLELARALGAADARGRAAIAIQRCARAFLVACRARDALAALMLGGARGPVIALAAEAMAEAEAEAEVEARAGAEPSKSWQGSVRLSERSVEIFDGDIGAGVDEPAADSSVGADAETPAPVPRALLMEMAAALAPAPGPAPAPRSRRRRKGAGALLRATAYETQAQAQAGAAGADESTEEKATFVAAREAAILSAATRLAQGRLAREAEAAQREWEAQAAAAESEAAAAAAAAAASLLAPRAELQLAKAASGYDDSSGVRGVVTMIL